MGASHPREKQLVPGWLQEGAGGRTQKGNRKDIIRGPLAMLLLKAARNFVAGGAFGILGALHADPWPPPHLRRPDPEPSAFWTWTSRPQTELPIFYFPPRCPKRTSGLFGHW